MPEAGVDAVLDRVGTLARWMRVAGAAVGIGEVLQAHRALAAVDPASREASYHALRPVLCSQRRDLAAFHAAFEATFGRPHETDALGELMDAAQMVLPRAGVPSVTPPPAPEATEDPVPVAAAWSEIELLRHKDFADYTAAERAMARRLLLALARRGPQRLSRRTRATRRRHDVHDVRATLRVSLRHGGELIERRYREPTLRPRPLVLLCDVSGSMAPYARVLLQYLQAAVTARSRVEAFAFGTRLTRVTRELAGRDPDAALDRAARSVVDIAGGTRIGDAVAELNRVHGRQVGRGATVVLLSDGWDRGDPEVLSAEMARLRRTAHQLIWLNPLAADPRYEPLTRGMRAATPHVDHLLAGNSLASLEQLAELMEETA